MSTIPDILEERFTEPQGWRWHHFENDGRRIRFGTASPIDSIPDGVVVCLPGLSEFSEKYFEVARDCLNRNLAFWVIDWAGQGQSTRLLKNKHKRHSYGFQNDIDDLHKFIMDYIKHSSVHPDKGRIPLIMLGHSMGGNIGLRYLAQHPNIFECAGFSAPMVGIRAMRSIPRFLSPLVTGLVKALAGRLYITGGSNWREDFREHHNAALFSSDAARSAVHNAWCIAEPEFQVGSPTFGWVHHANASCLALQKTGVAETIQTHCMIAWAGCDQFVDNVAINQFTARLPHAKSLLLADSLHEIMMERDEIRGEFMDAFFSLIEERIVQRPESLKPF